MRGQRADDATIMHALKTYESNGKNAKKTAKDLGISRTTLRAWVAASEGREWSGSAGQPARVAGFNIEGDAALAAKWEKAANLTTEKAIRVLENVDPSALTVKDVKDLLIAGAVATEKKQLLTGAPTSRADVQRVVYVIGNPLRDAAQVAIGRTDRAQVPALEGEYVVTQDKDASV